jgi:hypothetical protein
MPADSSGYTTTLPGGKKITVASRDVAEQTYGTPEYRDAVKRYYDAGGQSGTGKNFKKWLSDRQGETRAPSSQVDERVVVPHHPQPPVKLASSKIVLTQSLLKLCEGNKEFSMARSDVSDMILEEKVAPQKFLGITVGSPKKGYSARIWLDEGEKEVKYQEIEDRSRSVGVITPGKGGFGIKPEALGKVQENPMADRMRGSIRQVVESAGWRLSYAS